MKLIVFLFFLGLPFSLPAQTLSEDNEAFYLNLKEKLAFTEGMIEFPSVNKRAYRADCSGYISFVFHWAGLDLLKLYGIAPNGVSAIWMGLAGYGFEVTNQDLQTGDIVFFHNTVDKNKNSKRDDAFTHIGIVEDKEDNGTVVFLHYGSKGVSRTRLNLRAPDLRGLKDSTGETVIFNDYLRRGGSGSENLAGMLYAGAMRLKLIKKSTLSGEEKS